MSEEIKQTEQTPEVKVDSAEAVTSAKKCCNLKPLHMFLIGILGMIVVAGIIGLVLEVKAVKRVSEQSFVLKVAKALHFSAAKINGERILYTDYVNDLNTLKKFYSNKPEGFPDATPEQMSDQVLSRLIANKLIEKEALKYNVTISNDEVNNVKAELIKQFTDEAKAEEELQNRYGWTMTTYLDKVVKPLLTEQKLQQVFASSTDAAGAVYQEEQVHASHILFQVGPTDKDAVVKAKAQKVLDQIKTGADFATMAKQYGSDSTKDQGGDLGWFGKGQMVPEFEQAVFAIEPGKVSDQLVKTQYGYHIVKVFEKKNVRNFVTYMDALLKSANIKILINVHNPFESLGTVTEDGAPEVVEDTATTK